MCKLLRNYLANFCQTFVNNISPRYKNFRYICKRFSLFDIKMKRCQLPDAELHVEPSVRMAWVSILRPNPPHPLHLETGDRQQWGHCRGPRLRGCTGKITDKSSLVSCSPPTTPHGGDMGFRSTNTRSVDYFEFAQRHCETLDGCSTTTRWTE